MSTSRGSREANRGRWRGTARNGTQWRGGSDDEQRNDASQRSTHNTRGVSSGRAGVMSRQRRPSDQENGSSGDDQRRGGWQQPSTNVRGRFPSRTGPMPKHVGLSQKENGMRNNALAKNLKTPLFGSTENHSNLSSSVSKRSTDKSWRYNPANVDSIYIQRMGDLHQTLKKNREKERKEAIKNGFLANPDKPTSLANAITPVGTCQDMCPEFERVERIVQKMVDKCEMIATQSSDTKVPYEEYMVKRFRRSAAGYDEQLPSDIRPPVVLQKTLNYLLEEVVGGPQPLGSVHKFVWDRTRSIRNDFSIQQVTKTEDLRVAIDCFERIARFHILSLHQLSRPGQDNGGFDHYQEREQLNNTLLSLMYYYDDSRHKLTYPNEAEFRAYCIIFEIQDQRPDIEDRAQNWPKQLLENSRVQTAMKLYAAAGNTVDKQGPLRPHEAFSIAQGNYGRFWSVIKSNAVSYLMACVAEIYFNTVRSLALESTWKAYRRGGQVKMEDLILGDLVTALGFDDEDQVQSFCEDHGFLIGQREDGKSFLDISSVTGKWLTDSVHRRPQIFSKSLVERKRLGRTLPAVINGLSASQARADGLVEDPTTTPTDVTDGNKKDKALFLSDESDEESANPKVSSITVSNGREPHFADTASVNPFKKLASLNETPGPSPFAKPSLIDIKESNSILPRLETVPKFNFFSPTLSTSSENTKPTVASSNVPSQPSSIWGQSSLSSSSSSGGFIWPSIPSSSIINTYVSDNLSKTPPASTNLQNLSGSSTSPSTTTTTAVMPSSILLPPTKPDRTSVNSQDNIIQPVKHFSSSLSPSALNIFPSGNNLHTSTSNDSTKPLFSVQQQVHPKDTPTIVQVPEPANSGLAYSTQPSVPETYRPLETPKGISTASGLSLTQSPTLTPPANINNLLPKAPLNHQNELMTPKIDPRPKLLDQLTSTLVRQNDGLLQQFIEYTVGPIVLKAMNQIKAERSREEAARGRRFLLQIKYLQKWKDNTWKRCLLRKGKERRQKFAQSMQALTQSAREARGTSRASNASFNISDQTPTAEIIAMPPPSKRSSTSGKPASSSGSLVDCATSHNVTTHHQKRKVDDMIATSDFDISRDHQSHHKHSRTLGDSLSLIGQARTSKSGPPFDFKSSLLDPNSSMTESMMKKARRLAPLGRTDTTQTDYFKLKALGIDPDTPAVPLIRKRRMIDDPESGSKRASKLSTSHYQTSLTESRENADVRTMRDSVSSNPETRPQEVVGKDDDELFAQMRQVRAAMSESISWYREEREKSAKSRSTSKSQERRAETEKQRKLREFADTPSRTAMRLRDTGANGLLPKNWEKSLRHMADAADGFGQSKSKLGLRGFAAITNGYGVQHNGVSSVSGSSSNGVCGRMGASAEDAIEL